MKRFTTGLLMCALLIGSGCEFEQPTATGGGTGVEGLTGTIVDRAGLIATGATVRIYPMLYGELGHAKSAAIPNPDSTFVDDSGRFAFRDVRPGMYSLVATWTHSDTSQALHLPRVIVQRHTDLGIQILQVTGAVVLELRANGKPVIGALCRVRSSPFEALSDSTGYCTLRGMSPGAFRIEVSAPGFPTTLTDTVIVRSGMTSGLRHQLGSGNTPMPTSPLLLAPSHSAVMAWRDGLRGSTGEGATAYGLK